MNLIKKIFLPDLNNAEYAAFMDKVSVLIAKATPETLRIDAETLSAFEENREKLTDAIVRLRGSRDTARLADLDNNRDRLAGFILTTARYASRLPGTAQNEAGSQLWLLLKPHRKLAQLPAEQETEVVEGILFDLAKDDYAAHVATLSLTGAVADLKATNDEYKSLSVGRTESRAGEMTAYGKEIRQAMDKQYDLMSSRAGAVALLDPTPGTDDFVRELNQLIAESKTLFKLRMPRTGAAPK